MSTASLSPVSYVVLGLIARDGPSTPYALKTAAAKGVANFWPFPHSQLYDEAARLASLGLLHEEREETGRRRRVYSLTEGGRDALAAWFSTGTPELPQVRDLALLKLFFGAFAVGDDLRKLALDQAAFHEARLRDVYPEIEARLVELPGRRHQLDAMRLVRDMERVMLDHWTALAEAPPTVPRTRRRPRPRPSPRASASARRADVL